MNYFDLFDLPIQLKVDKAALRQKFFALSRQSHPDHFAQSSESEQEQALETSAHLNKAYKTLTDDDAVLKYVLLEKGLLVEDEKYTLPPNFLMEMMDLNEAVGDVETSEAKTSLHTQLKNLEKELYEPVETIIENYREGVTTEKELLQVKDYYFKKKYLQRLAQQLDQML